ncbi:RNA-binding protein 34 isoform X2 [Folsomia candida]|uniref:RNA-binding protein 34 isoform X2 n=1 Tax=Folsomia candida TaxID=158441 RepID=UPI000B8F97EE|nr:RNA-binding protein 34 isoform X2 [Folsomia candida]
MAWQTRQDKRGKGGNKEKSADADIPTVAQIKIKNNAKKLKEEKSVSEDIGPEAVKPVKTDKKAVSEDNGPKAVKADKKAVSEDNGPKAVKADKKAQNETVGEIKKSLKETNGPKIKDPELEARTLFVGNVPKATKNKEISKLFEPFGGSVETIRLRCGVPSKPTMSKKVAMNRKDFHPERDSITAYIRFSCREDALRVKEEGQREELTLDGHHLVLDMADGSLQRDYSKTVYVGNLNFGTQDNELWEFFAECGKIESVRIIRDRDTGYGKGFGYVNFLETSSVELALAKNDALFKKRPLRVSLHRRREPTASAYGGGNKSSNSAIGHSKTGPSGGNATTAVTQHKKKTGVTRSQGMRKRKEDFAGDRTAELGKLVKLKRNLKNRSADDMKKARTSKKLNSNGLLGFDDFPVEGVKPRKSKDKKHVLAIKYNRKD